MLKIAIHFQNGLEMRTFTGAKTGNVYTVLRTTRGSFHVLVETEAKAAARDCAAQGGGNTREQWKSLWGDTKAVRTRKLRARSKSKA